MGLSETDTNVIMTKHTKASSIIDHKFYNANLSGLNVSASDRLKYKRKQRQACFKMVPFSKKAFTSLSSRQTSHQAALRICESSFLIHHGGNHDLFVCPC